ncbi:hypothetical protein Tco_0948083 [Tanacetum coccineum]
MVTRRMMIPELEKMSVEQLKAIKEQTDMEVNLLQDSLTNIRTATTRLDLASTALQDLFVRPEGVKDDFALKTNIMHGCTQEGAATSTSIHHNIRESKDTVTRKRSRDSILDTCTSTECSSLQMRPCVETRSSLESTHTHSSMQEAPSNGKGIVGFDFVDGDDRLDQPADIVSSNMICMLSIIQEEGGSERGVMLLTRWIKKLHFVSVTSYGTSIA